MQLGGFYIWTYTFHLIRTSAEKLKALQAVEEISKVHNNDLDASQETHLLIGQDQENVAIVVASTKSAEDTENQAVSTLASNSIHYWIPIYTQISAGLIFGLLNLSGFRLLPKNQTMNMEKWVHLSGLN